MKQFLLCLLLVFSLCFSVSCKPTGDLPDAEGQNVENRKPYCWKEFAPNTSLSSGIYLKIEQTNVQRFTYSQLENGELLPKGDYKKNQVYEANECCIVQFQSNNSGKIAHNSESFQLHMGIGVTHKHALYNYEQTYGKTIDRIAMTLTIDGVTHTAVERSDFSMFVATVATPVYDSIEGNATHIVRHYFPKIGVAKIPLSLFDFSKQDSIDVTVNVVFYAGEEVLPILFTPCSFRLLKTAKGYQFVGTDEAISGYVAYKWSEIGMDCIK